MAKDLTQQLKEIARQAGADIVSVGSMDRYEGAPKQYDPRYIFPEAKCIVGFAFRIPRGYLRGVEEGTHFYQYPAMGYASINEVSAPSVIRQASCFLEDNGYEGVAIRNYGGTGVTSDFDNAADDNPAWGRRVAYSRPVRPDYPRPDVYVHFRIAAFICGMGEIGYSKMFLTPQFGPRQRLAFLLTDAPLTVDPLYDGPKLCDKCMRCVAECPGALTAKESVKVTIAGREVEWSKIDEWYCAFAYASGLKKVNPFLPDDGLDNLANGRELMNGEARPTKEQVIELWKNMDNFYRKPNGYNPAMCAGRGCIRACMIHLEEQGKLSNKFHGKFRKRTPWWHDGKA